METKHIIFFAAFFTLVPLGIVLCCVWRKVLDIAMFLMVFCTTLTKTYDINFVDRAWYQGTTRGVEISFIDFFAIIIVCSVLRWRFQDGQKIFWPASLGLMLLYFLYCCFSVFTSDPMVFGILELSKMARGVLFFTVGALYIRSRHDIHVILWGLIAAISYEWYIATYQRYGPVFMPRSWGTLTHYNALSMYGCMILPILATAALSDIPPRLRLACSVGSGMAIIAVLLTVSRTGFGVLILLLLLVGLLCVGIPKRISPKQFAIGFAAVCMVCLMILKSWDTIGQRFSSERSLAQEYGADSIGGDGVGGRGEYLILAQMMVKEHYYGVGLNNWSWAVTNEFWPRLGKGSYRYHSPHEAPEYDEIQMRLAFIYVAQPAHSLLALTTAELGIPGLVAFALMWARWFQMSASFLLRRSAHIVSRLGLGAGLGLFGCFLQNLTEWGWRFTEVYLCFHLIAGMLAALYHMRDKPDMMDDADTRQRRVRVAVPARPGVGV